MFSPCAGITVTTWIALVRPEGKWILPEIAQGDGMAMVPPGKRRR